MVKEKKEEKNPFGTQRHTLTNISPLHKYANIYTNTNIQNTDSTTQTKT